MSRTSRTSRTSAVRCRTVPPVRACGHAKVAKVAKDAKDAKVAKDAKDAKDAMCRVCRVGLRRVIPIYGFMALYGAGGSNTTGHRLPRSQIAEVTGIWRLASGGWRLAAGGWRLAALLTTFLSAPLVRLNHQNHLSHHGAQRPLDVLQTSPTATASQTGGCDVYPYAPMPVLCMAPGLHGVPRHRPIDLRCMHSNGPSARCQAFSIALQYITRNG